MRPFALPAVWALCTLAVLVAWGCEPQERIVSTTGTMLQNLPGAVGGLNADGTPREGATAAVPGGALAMTEDDLIVKNPDGSVTLVSKIIQHTIFHLVRVLREENDALLATQVLSPRALQHFTDQGKEASEATHYFKENREDIITMLSRMPNAENTPGVIMDKTGRRDFRLRITGSAAKGLRFTEYWVTMEKGNWRVLWVQ